MKIETLHKECLSECVEQDLGFDLEERFCNAGYEMLLLVVDEGSVVLQTVE